MAPSRTTYLLSVLAVGALHLSLAAHFVDVGTILSDEPLMGADYDTHIGQTMRVIEGLDKWGELWVYDVQLLAGQPEGTIFDADNKGWELWTFVLWKCGLTPGLAFNTYPLMIHLLGPLLVAIAAALFGLGAWTSLLAALMASAIWWFDSWAHWCWWIGMVSYATASVAFLLPLALFFRFVTREAVGSGVAFVLVLPLCLLIHPYSFFMLVVPLATLYLYWRREIPRRHHLVVALAIVAALAFNAVWLIPAAKHWHYILDSAYFGNTGPGHLVADFFNLLIDPSDSGVIATRAAFRFLFLAMSISVCWVWWREQRVLAVAFGSALGALFVLGYFGSWLPGAPQMQPYRYVLPLSLLACVGAAGFVKSLATGATGAPRLALRLRSLVLILGLGTVQHLAGDISYFLSDALPVVRPMIDNTPAPLAMTGHPPTLPYRIPQLVEKAMRIPEMSDWVGANTKPGARVLVDNTHLGERLAWRSRVEVIGGFRHRNIAHSYANFFRRFENVKVDHDALARYLRTYAIDWVILAQPRPEFAQADDLLESLGTIELYSVYKARASTSKVLGGPGVVEAGTNRIVVTGSDANKPVSLSYHYHEQLICEPSCRVEREEIEFDPVGLIRVPAPHAPNFVVRLEY